MTEQKLPDHVVPIGTGEPFAFSCHPQIACFTHCCRELELVLTPYDVLRLRKATGFHSSELLEKYIVAEQHPEDIFPRFYLSMVDDGKASCVFISEQGCSLYQDRPGACRTYPLGRAASREKGRLDVFFVLLHEQHCLGFTEPTMQTVSSFSRSQGLEPYNRFNDLLTTITQHEKIRRGLRPGVELVRDYTLALYDIDTFRARLQENAVPGTKMPPETIYSDDEKLLAYAMAWLENKISATVE